jgi:hypothetical protein
MLRTLLAALALCCATGAGAEPPIDVAPKAKPASKPAAKAVAKKAAAKPARPTWAELSADQQMILAPLKPDWDNLEAERKRKWIGIAKRYPAMQTQEQERVQRRMQNWAKLTPEQRRQARETYREIARGPAKKRGDLRQQWADYQALPPHERERMVFEPAEPAQTKKKK